MPLNLIKKYPELLDILALNERDRIVSLKGIFKRDIEDNIEFCFRTKIIRPIAKKDGKASMDTLFHHLITRKNVDDKGNKLKTRSFDIHRSRRLHWIKFHTEEKKQDKVNIFSCQERIDGKNRIRTYIYDINESYVIILEPQKSEMDYYLITAYYINEVSEKRNIEKKNKRKLDIVY